MKIHDCLAGNEMAFFAEIHMAIQQGVGEYRCPVPQGVEIHFAADEIQALFPEVEVLDKNERDSIILLAINKRCTVH